MTKKRMPSSTRSVSLPNGFSELLGQVKQRIQTAQTRAIFAVNAELVRLYWDIGHLIEERQRREGWGALVIPRLALELKNELPDLKGFSERNIGYMIAFAREYPTPETILQQPAAKLVGSQKVQQPAAKLASQSTSPIPMPKPPDSMLW